jgi:hypothetical protein
MTQDLSLTREPLTPAEVILEMRAGGLSYGSVYEVSYFEQRFGVRYSGGNDIDQRKFGLLMSALRRELEKDGFYITGRGGRMQKFWILPPNENRKIMLAYSRQATDCLARGTILGTSTPLSVLEPDDRRRHERMLEKIARMKLALTNYRSLAFPERPKRLR